MNNYFIQKTVSIYNNSIFINGNLSFIADKNENESAFLKQIYKKYEVNYPKFFKMDLLSKLGFMNAHILLKNSNIQDCDPEETAIIFANSAASLHTDRRFQETVNEIPSPAVFVYTLANIVVGEICIKYKIRGETAFFIQEKIDIDFLKNYTNIVLSKNKTKQCLVAWVNADNNNYESTMILVTKNKTEQELNELNFNNIFNK